MRYKLPAEYCPAVFTGPRRAIEVSQGDLLWAARGILGEGGPHVDEDTIEAYLWAIMRRCLLLPGQRTYGEMWTAFSQPINPRWRSDGDKCDIGGAYHDRPECSAERLKRREKLASTPWEKVPVSITSMCLAFGCGLIPPTRPAGLQCSLQRLSNWASYPGVEAKFPHGIDIGGEWFFEDEQLMDGEVKVEVRC